MQVVDYERFADLPRWFLLTLETDEGTVGWGEPMGNISYVHSQPVDQSHE